MNTETARHTVDDKKVDRRIKRDNNQQVVQIQLPRIRQKIAFIDPDTNKKEKFVAVNRAVFQPMAKI